MVDKVENAVGTGLNILGIYMSIEDISNTLNLILLIVSVLSLLIRGFFMVYDHLKNKDMKGAADEVEKITKDLTDVIKDTKDNIEKENSNKKDKE